MIQVKMSEKVLPAFTNFWINSDKYLYKILKGGRNSSKSTHVSIRIIFDIMQYNVNAVAMRKVANTLETSCFEQLKWAIDYLGVNLYWKCKKNPLEITYLPTKCRILFRGADEPEKIKSIKTSNKKIGILWLEELTEFTEEDEQIIVDSILRGNLDKNVLYSIFCTYNPPRKKSHRVNRIYNSVLKPKNCYVHHSTYLDNPYVSREFIERAEEIKKTNINKYNWIYMGEPIGSGITPFTNVKFREISKKEIEMFDNVRQGIDWGYGVDPFAFVRLHYDVKKRKIYIFDEIYETKLSNRLAAQKIISRKYNDIQILADSAEPKSIDEIKQYGINIVAAKKGPGSVEFGEKWLDDLDEIIIDPKRTPFVAKEFEDIDYEVDRFGNLKNKLEDKNNHGIDAVRYALGCDMIRRKFEVYDI